MTRTVTVAALQSAYGLDQDANIARTIELVREAAGAGAQVILPSELFQGPYFCVSQEERWFATAHPWREHPCVMALAHSGNHWSQQMPTPRRPNLVSQTLNPVSPGRK